MPNQRPENRSRLLRRATSLFQRQGYPAAALNELLDGGDFPGGEEQLTVEAVLLTAAELGAQMVEVLDRATDPVAAIVTLGALFARPLAESGYRGGCTISTIALELAADHPEIRTACAHAYGGWLGILDQRFRAWGVPTGESAALAEVVLSGIEGALVLAKVRRDCAPIHQVTARLGALVASRFDSPGRDA